MSMANTRALLVSHYGVDNCLKVFALKAALGVRLVNLTNISSGKEGSE